MYVASNQKIIKKFAMIINFANRRSTQNYTHNAIQCDSSLHVTTNTVHY